MRIKGCKKNLTNLALIYNTFIEIEQFIPLCFI